MNIIVGKNSGFCAGVKYTISKTEEELSKTSGKVDCLGEIIHNKQVVNSLEQKGLRIINSIDEAENNHQIVIYFNAKDSLQYAEKIFKDHGFNTKVFEQEQVAEYIQNLQSTANANTTTRKAAADIKSAKFALVVSSGDLTQVELNQNIKECLLVE